MYQRAQKTRVLYNFMNQHVVTALLTQLGKMKFWEFIGENEISIKKIADNYKYHPEAVKRFMRVLNACQVIKLDEIKGTVKKGLYTDALETIAAPHLLDGSETLRFFEKTLIENQECYSHAFGKTFIQTVSSSEEKITRLDMWAQMRMDDWLYPVLCNNFDFLKYKIICEWMGDGRFLLNLLRDNPKLMGLVYSHKTVTKVSDKNTMNETLGDRLISINKEDIKFTPGPGDLYAFILSLLQLSDHEAISALNTCYNWMPVNAKCVIVDFYLPDEIEEGYLDATIADINVLTCLGKKIRSKNEWLNLLTSTFFKNFMFKRIVGPPEPLVPMCIIEIEKIE